MRAHKFFGFSPVEQIILTINIGLRRQIHLLNYYTEGNVPEALAQVPKEWSADQISEFQEWFDSALAGNSARRRRITFVPECGNLQFTRDPCSRTRSMNGSPASCVMPLASRRNNLSA